MNKEWEKELREKWANSHGITTIDFIIQEVAAQKKEIVEMCEGMKIWGGYDEYNSALSEIINKLKE